jgi:nicotinate-nucleotide pyrophosphorylase (carboxylating)
MIDPETLRCAVRAALEEDLGSGDVTSRAVIDVEARGRGRIVARQPLVVAGLLVAREVFRSADPDLEFREACVEGASLKEGELLAVVEGSARSILGAERTALNFLQRLCGIATATRRAVALLERRTVQISDTRKTVPGLRQLDKYAVSVGGGFNHRAGLYDGLLIKNNHWRLAGGVVEAVRRARRAVGDGSGTGGTRIQVEVGSLADVRDALEAGAEALLLDNMDAVTLERALKLARGRAFLEVSGGVQEEDIPRLAATGVDRISVGALTHSVRAADIALELDPA